MYKNAGIKSTESVDEFLTLEATEWSEYDAAIPVPDSIGTQPEPSDDEWNVETSPLTNGYPDDCLDWVFDEPDDSEHNDACLYCERHIPAISKIPTNVLRVLIKAIKEELEDRDSDHE